MRYSVLAELYERLSSTSKRLEKTAMLSNFLQTLLDSDKDIIYLLVGNIYPSHDERKIGISDQLVIKAISKASGIPSEKIVDEWRNIGDLGKVAEKFIRGKKQSTLSSNILTTEKVIDNLRKLPLLEGQGTVDKKIALITELLTSSEPIEAKYIVRTLLSDLRVGIKESTIRDSLAEAFFKEGKEVAGNIQKAIDKSNDLGEIFILAKKGKIKDLDRIEYEVGKPIKVMLAQKAKTIADGFEAVGKPCAIEYKYDGFRLLISKNKKVITLYTRRLENVTKQFPEVIEYVNKYVKGDSFILDSEAVGYDKITKKYMPFQAISQRIKRKYDIEKVSRELPIEINVFDILHFNGKPLLDLPFKERTKILKGIIEKTPYRIIPSKQIITDSLKKAEEFYKQALKDNQEGVMMKNLSSPYNPGSRVGHMLKIKPSDRDLDLVIVGGEYGTGKRSGWLSSFDLACRTDDGFLEVGKVATGVKEKVEEGVSYDELTKLLKPLIFSEDGRGVKIKPKIVVSITYQELQKSPTYSSGFALRFPRFTALRPDRNTEDVASIEDIKDAYEKQNRN
ncbi:MAG TPA: ATP-dependent DNA ligase [Candidatus Nanoarchaeia archaeon]|nr:ATP-dependent DNA ligase [Candidatus Nanoarchaeia archaeon]